MYILVAARHCSSGGSRVFKKRTDYGSGAKLRRDSGAEPLMGLGTKPPGKPGSGVEFQ